MKNLKKLTVSHIRSNYWDKTTDSGKPFKCWIFQEYANRSQDTFTPLGMLLKTEYLNPGPKTAKSKKVSTYIENWLSSSKTGPYKKSDTGKMMPTLYYLAFTSQKEPGKIIWLQVCSGPLNVVSWNCINNTGVWIKKDQ